MIKLKLRFSLLLILAAICSSFAKNGLCQNNVDRPNILWITCEDISPYLGCYGFEQAQTPNLDKLAEQGIRYTHAYANAPVCAVARSTILSGMYATTLGTHQMRTRTQLPSTIPVYPRTLRQAGYYCTNNVKKDYNSNLQNDNTIWDESSNKAHYRNRKPGQPFFAVFNNTVTHESQLNKPRIQHYIENNLIPVKSRVNPSEIKLPPYHPDLPEIRKDWARLHDLITLMDQQTGELLQELKSEELAENTIVFFYSDHGGQLSRSKRYIYNVGTQVPLIVYLPKKWQHLSKIKTGTTDDSMVSFVDLAKTVLSISGCPIPDKMQGRIFLGPKSEEAPQYVHFYRDRMAERYDFSRAVTDGQYYFIRNFMPHRPRGRDSRYGYTVQANWIVWEKYFDAGKCNTIQSQFFEQKSTLELFDTDSDPWHVNNVAKKTDCHEIITRLSNELDRWMVETKDIGLIPEPMFHELVGEGKKHATMHQYAQSSEYPIEVILNVAKNASTGNINEIEVFKNYISNNNPIIRFWGAYGVFLTNIVRSDIQSLLMDMAEKDEFAANRIIASQSLAVCGNPEFAFNMLMNEVNQTKNTYVLLMALNAFQFGSIDDKLTLDDWRRFELKKFPQNDADAGLGYPQRIIADAISLWPEKRKVY